jgi:dihydrodipicolinate synthase/N-acetylneuraminate lyase
MSYPSLTRLLQPFGTLSPMGVLWTSMGSAPAYEIFAGCAQVAAGECCPQRGQQLSQDQIGQSLASILELGLPMAIYQLPQVTLNEIGPDLAADLSQRYQNFIFFKDTSGSDVVARSGKDLAGVFAARGAEGDYARWLKAAGGPYDGFLLSSANCFARELHQIVDDVLAGRLEAARQLSQRVAAAISEMSTSHSPVGSTTSLPRSETVTPR